MIVTLPLTGKIKELGKGTFTGDNDNPVRPAGLEKFGDVSWKMVSIDIEHETMTIDVTPAEHKVVNSGTDEEPAWGKVAYTTKEKEAMLVNVASLAGTEKPSLEKPEAKQMGEI